MSRSVVTSQTDIRALCWKTMKWNETHLVVSSVSLQRISLSASWIKTNSLTWLLECESSSRASRWAPSLSRRVDKLGPTILATASRFSDQHKRSWCFFKLPPLWQSFLHIYLFNVNHSTSIKTCLFLIKHMSTNLFCTCVSNAVHRETKVKTSL